MTIMLAQISLFAMFFALGFVLRVVLDEIVRRR